MPFQCNVRQYELIRQADVLRQDLHVRLLFELLCAQIEYQGRQMAYYGV